MMDIYECPHCKNQIQIKADTRIVVYKYGGLGVRRLFRGKQKSRMGVMESSRKMDSEAMALPQPKPTGYTQEPRWANHPLMQGGGISARRESSDYMPTRESHVDVPWQQAIRRGALIGGLVLVAGVGGLWVLSSVDLGMFFKLFDSRHPLSLEYIVKQIGWFKLVLTGLIGGIVVTLWVAIKDFARQTDFYDNAITRLEEFTRQDLDGDGYIGEPDTPPTEINLPAPKGAKRKVRFDLPGDQRKLAWFAWAVLHPDYAVNFSFYGAERSGYGKTAFGKLRDIFLAEGWAFIKDPSIPNSELELTGDGKQFLFQLARQVSKPLPDVDLSGPEAPENQYKRFTNIEY